jgi:hypothetical protein
MVNLPTAEETLLGWSHDRRKEKYSPHFSTGIGSGRLTIWN